MTGQQNWRALELTERKKSAMLKLTREANNGDMQLGWMRSDTNHCQNAAHHLIQIHIRGGSSVA